MTLSYNRDDAQSIQKMFTRIAPRYDLMNRVITAGQDVIWRMEVIRRAQVPEHGLLLDLGAGTGDLAREALKRCPSCHLIAADFTIYMMHVGRSRVDSILHSDAPIDWNAADAIFLPYVDCVFDSVVSGFLLRNVRDVSACLEEQFRVLKPGGRIVALDTTPPVQSFFTPLVKLYLRSVIPALGKAITGQGEAYQYLPASTATFLEPEQLAARLFEAGFRRVGYQRLMFGTIAIHWGYKPAVERR